MPFNLILGLILNVVVTVIWGHDIFRFVRLSVKKQLARSAVWTCKTKMEPIVKVFAYDSIGNCEGC